MNNYLVFREEGISSKEIGHRYKHNERTASRYNNTNIKTELSDGNYHFKKPKDSYEAIFQEMEDAGAINTKGLKVDAAHFSEIIIGVNREYWTDKSPEYIHDFFQAAYNHIEERFGEEMILSAVLHLDEIDRDGFQNIHMHVTAIPTVKKERYFTKRSKEYKELAAQVGDKKIESTDERLLKEVERQVSHSKFFESQKDDSHRLVYSYSVWQDEILDALKAAGFTDLHRGASNQKAVHIHPSAYKNLMEKIKCNADGLLEDIKAEEMDENYYVVSKESFTNMISCKEAVEKETAAYSLAVESLQKEQTKVYERQNKVYQTAMEQVKLHEEEKEYKRLMVEADRLLQENKQLRSILESLKEKVTVLFRCFKEITDKWILFRSSEEADKTQLIHEMDGQIEYGISLLCNQKKIPNNINLNLEQQTR